MFILFIFATLFCLIQSVIVNNNTTLNFYRRNIYHSGYLIKKYNTNIIKKLVYSNISIKKIIKKDFYYLDYHKIIINMKVIKKKFLIIIKFK